MGKNQSASNLTNIIKQDASGNITFVSGSTTLMSVSSSGAIATTGNVAGTASYASNAELLDGLDSTVFTLTSSFAAQTASFTAFTASQNNKNGTYATTGSNTFAGIQTVNSNLVVTGSITAQTLVVQTITSSVDFVTGSTRFGNLLANTHVFSGSVTMNPGGLFVSSSGNVGIGTTTPKAFLEINSFNGNMRLYNASGVTNNHISTNMYWNGSSWSRDISAGMANIVIHPTAGIIFNTTGSTTSSDISERMRITADGNVGIGTTTPDGKLHVFGKTYARYGQDDMFAFYYDDNYRFGITNPSTDLRQLRVFTQAVDNVGFIVFATANNAERMRITSGGNVLIGHTTEGSFKLDVRSSSGNNFVQSYTQITTNGQQCGFVANSLWSGSERGVTWAMFKHGSITNPATYISFWSGTSTFQYMHMDDSGVLRLSSSSGDIGTANGTIVGTQTSDIRLKNVKESFNYGLNEILQINPIAFTFKNDINNTDKLGFSAQDMLNIIPESVYDTKNCIDGYDDTDDPMVKIPKSNDNVYGMDYTILIPVLVKAIQELKAENDTLKEILQRNNIQ